MQKFIRRRQVESITGLPRATIYDFMDAGHFPKPVKLGPKIVGWIESEIIEWQQARIAARDKQVPA